MTALKVGKTTANTITLRWEKPEYDGGSAHLHYIVTYSKNKMETTKENITRQLFITLDQLEPSTKYNIAVKARNPGGDSVPTETNATTTDNIRKTAFPLSGFGKGFS